LRGTAGIPRPGARSFSCIRTDTDADFQRLARCLSGHGVNVVLGGGGARGLAHVGVLRALVEADVPIDRIAGTSMGALVGSSYATGKDYQALLAMGREFFIEAKPHKEFTFPVFSLVRSRKLDAAMMAAYGDTLIEDLWLPYFCVSCDLSTGHPVTHCSGAVWRAARASISLPGIFVPAIEDGRLLVDGGVLNNLPGDVMQERFGGPLVAVSASPPEDLTVQCDEFPSPWRVLAGRVLPFVKTPDVPNILDFLVRTAIVGSIPKAEQVRRDADLFLAPPTQNYGMMQFEALEEIAEVGYQHARGKIEKFKKSATYKELMGT